MKNIYYFISKSAARKEGGVNLNLEVFTTSVNKLKHLGKLKVNTSGSKGIESEVLFFLIKNKHISATEAKKQGTYYKKNNSSLSIIDAMDLA
jgi:hypothetical protein